MLGENHSLKNEFAQYQDIIKQLMKTDQQFVDANKYDAIDAEIRELELNSAPISDQAMRQLKHDRAVLKDQLYQSIISAQS